MVINHTSCDLEEGIHPLIFVTQCPSGVGTEARFVRVNGNGVALSDKNVGWVSHYRKSKLFLRSEAVLALCTLIVRHSKHRKFLQRWDGFVHLPPHPLHPPSFQTVMKTY